MSVNRITDLIREIGMPEPQYGEDNATAYGKISAALEALICAVRLMKIILDPGSIHSPTSSYRDREIATEMLKKSLAVFTMAAE